MVNRNSNVLLEVQEVKQVHLSLHLPYLNQSIYHYFMMLLESFRIIDFFKWKERNLSYFIFICVPKINISHMVLKQHECE